MRVKYWCDAKAYENYYLSQVGHGMPYFAGARVQQGYGLGNTSYRVKTSNKLPSTKPKQQVRISCKRPNESERRHREKYKRRNARNIMTFLREPWQR